MIANITISENISGFVQYNTKKVNKQEAKLLAVPNTIDNTVETATTLLNANVSQSKRKSKFIHISLNFPKEDKPKLNPLALENIAKDYLKNIELPKDNPYIIYEHYDKEHPHIHIVTSTIDAEGKHFNDFQIYKKSQKVSRALEKKYNLKKVVSNKQHKVISLNTPRPKKVNKPTINPTDNLSTRIQKQLDFAINQARITNLKELQEILNKAQLNYYTLEPKANPKHRHTGIVYVEQSNNFTQSSKGIKGSNGRLAATIPELKQSFTQNKSWHKTNKQKIRREITNILNLYNKINYAHFTKQLAKRNIEFNYTLSANGQLVGVSFTDTKNSIKYTGEQLGTAFKSKALAQILTPDTNEIKPSKLTQLELNKYYPQIQQLPIKEQLHYLQHLGFTIKIENNAIFISDYKNPANQGYLKLDLKTDLSTRFLYPPTDNRIIDYNRAIVTNNNHKANTILEQLDKDSYDFTKENNEFVQALTDDAVPNSGLEDIDKRKKKRTRRTRKR